MSFKKALYFAFGSNLLRERMELDNDCQFNFKTIAKLSDWRLNFDEAKARWGGGIGDIIPEEGSHLWGVVWETDRHGIEHLDRQEGLKRGVYEAIYITVETPEGEEMKCRTYRLVHKSGGFVQPSRYYKEVILRGAEQNNLPPAYILKLKEIPVNDFVGEVPMYVKLGMK